MILQLLTLHALLPLCPLNLNNLSFFSLAATVVACVPRMGPSDDEDEAEDRGWRTEAVGRRSR